MAKIALLEPVADPTGDESVVILKDGVAKRASFSAFAAAAVAPALAVAQSWAELAQNAAAPMPVLVTARRAVRLTDHNRTLLLNLDAPGDFAVEPIILPSNSVDPLPVGTRVHCARTGGAFVTFLPDEFGEANITLLGGEWLSRDGAECVAIKTGENDWVIFGTGLGDLPENAFTVPVWLDPSDLDSLRQERTGAAATTPVAVGDPIGSIRNKGTKGGWATATANSRRPILRQTNGFYWFETDGADDFLLLDGLLLNLAQVNVFIGCQVLTEVAGDGVLTFQTATNSDVNRNDGGFFAMNGSGEMAWRMGIPALSPTIPGLIHKAPHVYELRKPGNNQTATTSADNGPGNESAVATNLGIMARNLIIGGRQGNNAEGVGQFGHVGYYSIVITDQVLNAAQRAAIRTYTQRHTYPAALEYPAIANLTQRNAARATLITETFGGSGIPTDVGTLAPDSAAAIGFGAVPGIANFEKMTLPGVYSAVAPRVITPVSPNGKTVLCWIGHTFQLKDYGVPDVVVPALLALGYRVVLLAPPGGGNDYTAGDPGNHNTNMPPLKLWSGAASIAINTLLATNPGMTFYMCGISGGGWATGYCAAVDARIIGSTQFVGSLPSRIYINRDWEQRLPGLTADYLTIYLLAASNGWHNHVLYEFDTAGFNRAAYDTLGIDWSPTLAALAAALGGDYDLSWVNFNQHAFQAVSFAAQFISRLPPPA
jgi:hypothetical protein